jgi:hypothetical protein
MVERTLQVLLLSLSLLDARVRALSPLTFRIEFSKELPIETFLEGEASLISIPFQCGEHANFVNKV